MTAKENTGNGAALVDNLTQGHKFRRNSDFTQAQIALSAHSIYSDENATVACGDSLQTIKLLPDSSISLILTDPPYHSTKKKNITNDASFESDSDFLAWIHDYSVEWKRILKPNGSLFMFCSSTMAAQLEILLHKKFNVLSHVVWTKPNDPGFDGWKQKMRKEALRQWYDHTERILFCEPAMDGNLHRSSFASFLRQQRHKSGLTCNQLTEITEEFGKVNRGGAASNWETGRNIPSRDQYHKISGAFLATGKVSSMPPYEDVVRPFNVDSTVEFTDVWNFSSVRPYKGKHPAEKPLDMLEHAINSTSFPHDIVLDCFAGSGSTSIAALNTGRRSISIEIEPEWAETIKQRVSTHKPSQKKRLAKVFKSNDTEPRLF